MGINRLSMERRNSSLTNLWVEEKNVRHNTNEKLLQTTFIQILLNSSSLPSQTLWIITNVNWFTFLIFYGYWHHSFFVDNSKRIWKYGTTHSHETFTSSFLWSVLAKIKHPQTLGISFGVKKSEQFEITDFMCIKYYHCLCRWPIFKQDS